MKMSFRWYGPDDPVTLQNIRQIPNMQAIVTAVYDVPVGEVWSRKSIAALKKQTEDNGLQFEVIESVPILVVKKDKSREVFDRNKLLGGMMRACEKRQVSMDTLERAVDDIEANLQNSLDREVSSMHIGELAMQKLKDIDEVAYVRFASVYRQFKDINAFMDELSQLLRKR